MDALLITTLNSFSDHSSSLFLKKSVMFLLSSNSATMIMYPTCEDPLLLPLKVSSEKIRISVDFVFSFSYFRPSFGCFFKFLMSAFIILGHLSGMSPSSLATICLGRKTWLTWLNQWWSVRCG